MINFSFIIPHKNTPDLLQKCLDSIPRRDGVQIIVVDDNSDPEKVDFETFPGIDDPFVEVYLTKEGKGAGYARNIGLDHASGRWIIFADADDYFHSSLNQAMDEFLDSEAEIVFFRGDAIYLHDNSPSSRGEAMNDAVATALRTGSFTDLLLISCPYKKFIKKKLLDINHIRFNETRWANDVVFSARISFSAGIIAASELSIYCITESNNSLIKTRTLASQETRFIQECEANKILRKRFPSNTQLAEYLFQNWFDLYKISKKSAIHHLPNAISAGGGLFVEYLTIQTIKSLCK